MNRAQEKVEGRLKELAEQAVLAGRPRTRHGRSEASVRRELRRWTAPERSPARILSFAPALLLLVGCGEGERPPGTDAPGAWGRESP